MKQNMAYEREDDIYGNKAKYERLVKDLDSLLEKPQGDDKRKKYYCKNKTNLRYFGKVINYCKKQGSSYISYTLLQFL